MSPKLTIAILLGFSLHSFSQTVVIVKKTPKGIYAGADSRLTEYNTSYPSRKIDTILYNGCKIFKIGKFNFAAEGDNIGDNVYCGRHACWETKTFAEAMEHYKLNFKRHLTNYLENSRLADPAAFAVTSKPMMSLAEGFFFGYENGICIMSHITFYITTGPLEHVNVEAQVKTEDLMFGGLTYEIRDTIQKESTWKAGYSQTIKALIKIESKFHPIHVGGPIRLLFVTPKESTWINAGPDCQLPNH